MRLVRWSGRIIALIILIMVLCVGGSYIYIIRNQSRQFVETTKDQARVLTHAIVRSIQHDWRGAGGQDIQGIFERIGILPLGWPSACSSFPTTEERISTRRT